MNKLLSLLAILAMSFTTFQSAMAQTEMTEGTIVMELTDVQADDPAMSAQLSMLKGSSNSVYFNSEKVLTKMDMMGGMVEMNIVSNPKDKTGYMLFNMDMLGKKIKVNIDEADVKKQQEETAMNDMTVTYDKADTKKIAGYNCYKATISSPAMQGAEIVAYVTQEIKVKADIIQGVQSDLIEGFPLEYSVGAQGMSMVYTTTKIEPSVDAKVFELDTVGYEEMTMEEFQKSMGAMGGMGF